MNLQSKKVTSMLLLSVLVLSLVPSIFAYQGFQTHTKGTDFVVLEGAFPECCKNDMQYSYKVNTWATSNVPGYPTDWTPDDVWYNASKVLRIAMTEYGEFAASDGTNHDGIAYGADYDEWETTESWASTAVGENQWVQGWLFYVNYTYWLQSAYPRAILAYSLYSGPSTEGARTVINWDARYNTSDENADIVVGYLNASGVQVLYDSARLAVIRASVVIHDNKLGVDFAKITFTVIFDKCGKEATVFKDVKFLFGKAITIHDFAFSERYELDLAAEINENLASYVHWYSEFKTTAYWHPELGTNTYDVVQAYDSGHNYIFAAAYWPSCTEYDVFMQGLVPDITGGTTGVLEVGTAEDDIGDGAGEPDEPYVPLIAAQWRYTIDDYPQLLAFFSSPGPNREIRFVEALTMTDYSTDRPVYAEDYDDTGFNVVDAEVQYLFDYQIFNPEDLNTLQPEMVDEECNVELTFVNDKIELRQVDNVGPFMYTVVGVGANIVDDLAAEFLSPNYLGTKYSAFPILDMPSPLLGTIAYALDEVGGEGTGFFHTYNSHTLGIGEDTTTYYYTAMKEFAFDFYTGEYDEELETFVPPQPIKGGLDVNVSDSDLEHFYPSINPLTMRWEYNETSEEWYVEGFNGICYDPNGMITVGGPKANQVTRYFNDYMYAITREGSTTPYKYYALVNGEATVGTAPTSDMSLGTLDFFPLSTWNSSATTFNYQAGYAVIALGRDEGGLRGLAVYGWDARDTYWASEWAAKFILGESGTDFPAGTVALVIHITYTTADREPSGFEVVQMLGTITQFGANMYIDRGYDWDHGPYADNAEDAWYHPNHLGTWCYPYDYDDVWWFMKFPTTDESLINFDD